MLNLIKLEQIAKDAPQGTWHYTPQSTFTLPTGDYSYAYLAFDQDMGHDFTPDPEEGHELCKTCGRLHYDEIDPLDPEIGAYYVAFSPETVLELIAELRSRREQVRQIRLLAMSTDHLQLRRKINDALGDPPEPETAPTLGAFLLEEK